MAVHQPTRREMGTDGHRRRVAAPAHPVNGRVEAEPPAREMANWRRRALQHKSPFVHEITSTSTWHRAV
jgi:hypothetical protein